MTRALSSIFLLLVTSSLCFAEVPKYDARQPQRDGITLVGMECDSRNRILEIGLFFPSSPPTKRMDLWKISDLVKFSPSTYFLEKVDAVERRCTFGSSRYKVRFEGIPGANNAMWMCGAGTGVHATIWKNEKMVFDDDLYKCNQDDYIGAVRLKHDALSPEIDRQKLN